MKKAETIRECLASLDNSDLTDENFDLFYEPIPKELRPDIVGKLNYCLGAEERFKKFVVTGHRGVGKSTEIVRAKRELCDKYCMVLVNVNDAAGTNGRGYADILVRIVNEVSTFLVDGELIDENDILFDHLLNYWNSETKIQDVISEIQQSDSAVKVEAEVDSKLNTKFKILSKLGAALSIGMNVNAEISNKYSEFDNVDEIVTRTITKNDGIFLDALNNTLDAIQKKLGNKKLLIVLEDMDKDANSDLINEVFNRHIALFARIRATMIFTMAVHYLYDTNIRQNLESMSMTILNLGILKIFDRNHNCISDGMNTMKQMIMKRMDSSLIEETALEYAIRMSGGLFRDLINILCHATLVTGPDGRDKITMNDVKDAVAEFQTRYVQGLSGKSEVDKIVEIYNGEEQFGMSNELRELLRKEAVLGYDNSGYRVHPLILQYLAGRGRIEWIP